MNYFIQDHLALVLVVGIVGNGLILYVIINAATRATTRAKYEWAQLELLGKMAKAQGVPEEEIKAIFTAIK